MLFIITGHGAGDCGSCGNGFQEAERVRVLAQRIKDFGGDNVTIGDTTKNWYRSNLVNNSNIPKGVKVLELHLDCSDNTAAKGGHVIINSNLNADKYDVLLSEFISETFPGRSQKIVKRNDLANMSRAYHYGINYRLLECCFISNKSDIKKFNSKLDYVAKGILECFNIPYKNSTTTSTTQPNVTTTNVNVTYAVKVKNGNVLPEVHNLSDYAGIEKKEITDLAVKVDNGTIKYQVHIKGGKWLPYVTGYNWSDVNNGYAGNGKVIDAIRIVYVPNSKTSNKKAKYRVSPTNSSKYYDWQINDIVDTKKGYDGYAGCYGVPIDKIQIIIE